MTLRLFLLNPDTIFAARVNQTSFTYPLNSVEFDGVTTGAFGDIEPGMTVLFGTSAGADDLGRQRIRLAADSDTVFIGRSSEGNRDGEVDLQDDAYITVLNDYRVWAKIPYIEDDGAGTSYKDEIAYTDQNTDNYPVANAGPAIFATIDGGSIITINFDSVNSITMADGASLSTYLWDVDDGTITVGTTASSAITATFPAGFRWVSLTVTDDNSKSHTTRVPVYARDPSSDTTIASFHITSHSIRPEGQKLNVRVLESIPESTYPDGTLVLIADGEPSDADDRSNLLFCGWHQNDPADMGAERTGLLTETTLKCADVAGRLDTLPGYSASCRIANTPDKWEEMYLPNMDKFAHFILQWHSTALDVADFTTSGTGATYKFSILGAEGESIWDMAARKFASIIPNYKLVCNTLGQLTANPDPMYQETGDRTATIQATLTEADWADIRYEHIRRPRIHWLKSYSVLANHLTDLENIPTKVCRAPGLTPGQGETEMERGEGLTISQTTLNQSEGHRYARINAPETPFTIILAEGDDLDVEPADMTWVKLTIGTTTDAQRGLNFTEERGLPLEMTIRYQHTRTGTVRTVEMKWERETIGIPAVTYIPLTDDDTPDDDWWDDDYDPPTEDDDFYDPVQAYIIWDYTHIGRTMNVMVASPTWELVDTGITGGIIDVQYVTRPSGNETAGAWALTVDGVWWCADILATTPSWSNTLDTATMQAAESAPLVGTSGFINMFNHGARPGWLIVKTMPSSVSNLNWAHAYVHITEDYGATWDVVDTADDITYTAGGNVSGYMFGSPRSTNWYRDLNGRIYMFGCTPWLGGDYDSAILYSDDDGQSWGIGDSFSSVTDTTSRRTAGVLNPYPSPTDFMFIVQGTIGASARPELWTSITGGSTTLEMANPSGYDGFSLGMRPNSKTSDPSHVIAWAKETADTYYDIVDSDDAGLTWSVVYDPGSAGGAGNHADFQSPDGWPANDNVWFIIKTTDDPAPWAGGKIFSTEDYFATAPTDRTGNLETVWGGDWDVDHGVWDIADGFALPKIGNNA